MIFLNPDYLDFPHHSYADDRGLLCVGGDLSLERLKLAYRIGTFPWYNSGEQPLWWHPDPRFVIFPDKIKISKSMRSYFNKEKFTLTIDTCPEDVLYGCSKGPRKGDPGTWLSGEFFDAYMAMYHEGLMHTFEVWDQEKRLVGGLYGISIGNVFFGESMFSYVNNASKFALICLAKLLDRRGFSLIDCQMPTEHLKSMGGQFIPRDAFVDYIRIGDSYETIQGRWTFMTDGISYPDLIKKS